MSGSQGKKLWQKVNLKFFRVDPYKLGFSELKWPSRMVPPWKILYWVLSQFSLGVTLIKRLFRVDQKKYNIYDIDKMLLNKKITKDLQLLKWRRYLESVNDVSNLARVAKGQIVTLQKFCQEHSQFWETDARSDKSYSVTQFVKEHGCLRHMDFLSPSAVR